MGRTKDRVLLVAVALFVVITLEGAFWLGDIFRVNPLWVFFAGNSLLLVPVFIKDFKTNLRKPAFVGYLGLFAATHGLLVIALMRWVPLGYWIPAMAVELTLGYFLADYFFDVRPDKTSE